MRRRRYEFLAQDWAGRTYPGKPSGGERALQGLWRRPLIPYVTLVKFQAVVRQKTAIFFLKTGLAMVTFLIGDVADHLRALGLAGGKDTVTALPPKLAFVLFRPCRRTAQCTGAVSRRRQDTGASRSGMWRPATTGAGSWWIRSNATEWGTTIEILAASSNAPTGHIGIMTNSQGSARHGATLGSKSVAPSAQESPTPGAVTQLTALKGTWCVSF